jgi:hypothetical protein
VYCSAVMRLRILSIAASGVIEFIAPSSTGARLLYLPPCHVRYMAECAPVVTGRETSLRILLV